MTTVNDLKKDDVIYGLCVDSQVLEIYGVEGIDVRQILIYPIIGEGDFYLNFPSTLNLEYPILCNYSPSSWWIYTTNIDALEPFINIDNDHWDVFKDLYFCSYFNEYLDMWHQEIKKFKGINKTS